MGALMNTKIGIDLGNIPVIAMGQTDNTVKGLRLGGMPVRTVT